MGRFGRVLTAMVSPFDADGALDLDGAAELAAWLVEHGSDGLVVAGTTGEAPTLTHAEQADLIATVVDAVDVPVVAGAGSNDTRAAVDLTRRAAESGAEAILSVTPYYNRPSQQGLSNHFRAIAANTDLPIVLYDIPVRTGRKIDIDTMLELAHEVDNIVAVKDAAGDPAATARFLADAPDGFEVYSGDDNLTLPLLAVGAVGVVGVATHWTGAEHQLMVDAFFRGDVATAAAINRDLVPSFRFETSPESPNPIPTKAMLRVLGLPGGHCRPPMDDVAPGLEAHARDVLAGTILGGEVAGA